MEPAIGTEVRSNSVRVPALLPVIRIPSSGEHLLPLDSPSRLPTSYGIPRPDPSLSAWMRPRWAFIIPGRIALGQTKPSASSRSFSR